MLAAVILYFFFFFELFLAKEVFLFAESLYQKFGLCQSYGNSWPSASTKHRPDTWGLRNASFLMPPSCSLLSVYFSSWHRIGPQILTGKPPVPWFLSLELSLELRKEPAQNLGSISSLCFVKNSQLSVSACLTSLFSFPSIPVFSEHLELCTELCLSTTDSIPVPVHLLSPLPFPFCPFCTHTRQDERHGVTIT